MLLSDKTGKVDGRAEYATQSNMYYVTYKAADGRQVADWWGEENITAACVAVNDNSSVIIASKIEVPKVEYEFGEMGFDLKFAESGDLICAFWWEDTPQGFDYWDALDDEMTPEGQAVLDDMIAQYKAKQGIEQQRTESPQCDWQDGQGHKEEAEFKLEVGKYYESRDGEVYGPMKNDGDTLFPFHCDSYHQTWMPSGCVLDGLKDADDLIKEVPAPASTEFKLEVGKCYEDRNGVVYGPLETHDHHRYTFRDPKSFEIFLLNGKYWDADTESQSDLIKEVPAPQAMAA